MPSLPSFGDLHWPWWLLHTSVLNYNGGTEFSRRPEKADVFTRIIFSDMRFSKYGAGIALPSGFLRRLFFHNCCGIPFRVLFSAETGYETISRNIQILLLLRVAWGIPRLPWTVSIDWNGCGAAFYVTQENASNTMG